MMHCGVGEDDKLVNKDMKMKVERTDHKDVIAYSVQPWPEKEPEGCLQQMWRPMLSTFVASNERYPPG